MKTSKFQRNVIIVTTVILMAAIATVFLWYSNNQYQKQISECKTRTVDKYLDERYGDNRPELDIRIIEEVNVEALADCQK